MDQKKEWLELYNEKKKIMCPESSLEKYFTEEYIEDVKLKVVNLGKLKFTSGEIIITDPVYYFEDLTYAPILDKVPAGEYDVFASFSEESDKDGEYHTLIALKVQFTNNAPVTYREVVTGEESIEVLQDIEVQGDLIGIDVYANKTCIMDRDTAEELADYAVKHAEEDEEFDIEYDLYADELTKAVADNKKVGLNVNHGLCSLFSPISSNKNMLIVSDIYEDDENNSIDYYPAYIAEDKDGNVCQLVLQFYDLELEPADEDDVEE